MQASHCGGFSGCRAWPLGCVGLAAPLHMESSWTRDRTHVPCIGRRTLPTLPPRKSSSVSLVKTLVPGSRSHPDSPERSHQRILSYICKDPFSKRGHTPGSWRPAFSPRGACLRGPEPGLCCVHPPSRGGCDPTACYSERNCSAEESPGQRREKSREKLGIQLAGQSPVRRQQGGCGCRRWRQSHSATGRGRPAASGALAAAAQESEHLGPVCSPGGTRQEVT